jgi:hypothetical protein
MIMTGRRGTRPSDTLSFKIQSPGLELGSMYFGLPKLSYFMYIASRVFRRRDLLHSHSWLRSLVWDCSRFCVSYYYFIIKFDRLCAHSLNIL